MFGGGLEALWGHALPQIGKMRFGRCAGEVAVPRSLVFLVPICLNPVFVSVIQMYGSVYPVFVSVIQMYGSVYPVFVSVI